MLELLYDELEAVGLEMHSSKSRIMASLNDITLDCIHVRGSDLAVLPIDCPHRYLDRIITLADNLCTAEMSNRLRAAYCKFAQHYR